MQLAKGGRGSNEKYLLVSSIVIAFLCIHSIVIVGVVVAAAVVGNYY